MLLLLFCFIESVVFVAAASVVPFSPYVLLLLLLLLYCTVMWYRTMLCYDIAVAAATIEPYRGIDLIRFEQLLRTAASIRCFIFVSWNLSL